MSEQVKGIPEDLISLYRAAQSQLAILPTVPDEGDDPYEGVRYCSIERIELIERIARSEQALAALEAQLGKVRSERNALDDSIQGKERAIAASQQQIAALEARNRELKTALEFIASRERYTFAECTQAEEIIGAARAALKGAS